jgi:hypothetical protein
MTVDAATARLERQHVQLQAHVAAAYGLIAAAGELAVCQGDAYRLQVGILIQAEAAQNRAQAISLRHQDLRGWADVLADLRGDVEAFRGALVRPAPGSSW